MHRILEKLICTLLRHKMVEFWEYIKFAKPAGLNIHEGISCVAIILFLNIFSEAECCKWFLVLLCE